MSGKDANSRALASRIWQRLLNKHVIWSAVAVFVIVAALQFRNAEGDRPVQAQTGGAPTAPTSDLPTPELPHDVMAIVNGQDISRSDLTDLCIKQHGEKVLESLVNKHLIMNHCRKRGITISPADIDAEINRMASRFHLGREQWLDLIERERGFTPQEYARDIVWPTLALRQLAAKDIHPSSEEVQRTLEKQYGEKIQARLIAVSTQEKANQIHAELTHDPQRFARLAIEHSIDVNSASIGGLIQPISHHVGDPAIEQAAFSLQPGQISPILQVAGQYVILKCEQRLPARQFNRTAVEAEIVEKIKDEKLRVEADKLFAQLQSTATIQNVYNNPQLRETMPGVVATVNGDRITIAELGRECFKRHGEQVLEQEISQMLLSQAVKRAGVTVTQQDLDEEVRHAADLAGALGPKGDFDVAQWYDVVTKQQGITKEQYIQRAVWPSAALKKLAASEVKVTEEDLNKGFEANYGERVRCRAIVLDTMRRAQEVWEKARRTPTPEYFGDLAQEYSIEPTSKALRGEVPPLQKFGGQPQLEQVAFELQPGQLSGIVQVGEKFIILRCEGRTERMDVDMAEVREILYRDIHEKKMRMAMNEKFDSLRSSSRIDNYLAATSSAPVEREAIRHDTAVRPTAGQR